MLNRITRYCLLLLTGVALAGCSWVPEQGEYAKTAESKPLEVPPDLDAPAADGAVQVPKVDGTQSPPPPEAPPAAVGRNYDGVATASGQNAGVSSELRGNTLIIEDSLEASWRRVEFAAERAGLAARDANREKGTMKLEFTDLDARQNRPGFFSRLFSRDKGPSDDTGLYQLTFTSEDDEQTLINLASSSGEEVDVRIGEKVLGAIRARL